MSSALTLRRARMLSLLASLSVHSLERLDFMAFKLSRLVHSTYGNIRKCATSHCDEVRSPTENVVSRKHRRDAFCELHVGTALVQDQPALSNRKVETRLVLGRRALELKQKTAR